ncbi:Probable 2-oxoglutarate-dependent dioxygenase AOP1.2, partial [Linum grandiflorum]
QMDSDARIPLVNLSLLNNPGSPAWVRASTQVRRAMEDHGCLEIVWSNEFHSSILEALEQLFRLPQETKMKNINPKPAHGYMGKLSVLPIHEGLGIEYPDNRDSCEEFAKLMWPPHGNPRFCEVVHGYAKMVAELEKLVVRMLFHSYGMVDDESKLEAHSSSTTYLLRLLRYRRSGCDTNLGFKGHTDKSFVSVLHQNHVHGLEVRLNEDGGGQWVCYRPTSTTSSFLVLAGDAIMAWSNNRIKSCYHRVMVSGEEVRYAVGLFTFLTGAIEAPAELVDEEHPLLYKPFYHQGLLDYYVKNNAKDKGESNMVRAFCRV